MRTYSDAGNHFVAGQVPCGCRSLLDVGCGSGDTARLIKVAHPSISIEGVTYNDAEARAASSVVERIHVFDIEGDALPSWTGPFDCILFSHILEHVRNPQSVILKFLPHLRAGGTLIVAVPNVLEWRTRMRLLGGNWRYADAGILDRTHLRFFTFDSAADELFGGPVGDYLSLRGKFADGSVPLGPLRRLGVRRSWLARIDALGVRIRPNLFGQQVVLVATKRGPDAVRETG
jgi:SAM-dependent methyltransferase